MTNSTKDPNIKGSFYDPTDPGTYTIPYYTPDRPLDPPDHGDLPDLTEKQMAEVVDELWADYDWREDYEYVQDAYERALELEPERAEALTKEIAAMAILDRLNKAANERAIAEGLIDGIYDIFGPGSFTRRQAD